MLLQITRGTRKYTDTKVTIQGFAILVDTYEDEIKAGRMSVVLWF